MHLQLKWSTALLIAGLLWPVEAAWNLGMKEPFQYSPLDNAECTWGECRQSGGGKRLFQIRCDKVNGGTYGCIYEGNPHNCAAYNNGGQRKYYQSLAKKAAKDRANACSYWKELWSDTMCTEIVFERISSTTPAQNWCDV